MTAPPRRNTAHTPQVLWSGDRLLLIVRLPRSVSVAISSSPLKASVHNGPAPFYFVAGIREWSPLNRGCANFPTVSTSALLGSPVSAEYDPMRTAAKWSVHEGAGGSSGLPDELSAPWAGSRFRSRDPQSSEACGWATSLRVSNHSRLRLALI